MVVGKRHTTMVAAAGKGSSAPRPAAGSRLRRRDGSVVALVAIALVALVGCVALTVDVGRIILSAQAVQNTVDGAALAAANRNLVEDHPGALIRANGIVAATQASGHPALTWTPENTVFYGAGDTVPGYRLLTGYEEAVMVGAAEPVAFTFARILGLQGTTVTRNATAARLFAPCGPMLPMWVGAGTSYSYGVSQDLHGAGDVGADPSVPGNFGWLTPNTGYGDFDLLLCGYNVPEATMLANYMHVGETLPGLTGEKVGHWTKDMGTKGTGRLERATWSPWTGDTFNPPTPPNLPHLKPYPLPLCILF